MNQRRGRRAQDQFKLLCSIAGITCNPSLEDDYGWDFLIEIPMTAAEGAPADKWPPPRSAYVQVKSTRGRRPRTEMKVSNALRLAKKSAPCFMVLFQELNEGQRIYARLFEEKDMERTLRRARQLSVEGRAIHKARMSFAFPEQEKHTADLLNWMANCVEGLAPDYGETKSRLADRIGYDKKSYRATITFSSSRGLDDLVDLQLGLKDELQVSQFAVFDMRFGIEAPAPIMEDSGGVFRMQPENELECSVALQADDHVISLRSSARISTLKGSSPRDVNFSFTNELFILLVSRDAMSLTLRNVSSKKLPLRELEHLATMLAWHDQDVCIRVTGDVPDIVLRMHVSGDGRTLLDKGVAAALVTLRNQASRTSAADIRLSINDVLARYQELTFYRDVLSDAQMSICTRLEDPSFDSAILKNLLGIVDIELGEFTFVTMFDAAIAAHVNKSGWLEIQPGPRNARDSIVDKGRETVRSRGQAIHDRYSAAYGDDWLAVGSLNQLIESQTDGS